MVCPSPLPPAVDAEVCAAIKEERKGKILEPQSSLETNDAIIDFQRRGSVQSGQEVCVCVSGGAFKRPSGDAFVLGGGACIHLSYPLEAQDMPKSDI